MTIREVNVKVIDDSAHYLYPNRIAEIKTTGKPIVTPTRAATAHEYHEKAKVPTDIAIPNPVFINIERLTATSFQKFMNTNHYFSKLLKKMDLNNRLAQYSDLSLTLFQPTVTPKKDNSGEILLDSPMNILKQEQALRERFLRFIIRLHQESQTTTVAIPFIELPFSALKETFAQISKSLERINYQPVFFVDLNYHNFEQAIDFITNEIQSPLIGLIFRPFRNVPQSYEVLSKYIDKDVAFFSVQVPRYESQYNDISTMHYLPFFGNDVYAVKTPFPIGKGREETGKKRIMPLNRLYYLRFFDKQNLQVIPVIYKETIIEDLLKEYSNNVIIKKILENYHEASIDEEKYKVINAFSKTSEVLRSLSEFERFQKYVKDNATKDYVEEKAILQNTLQKVGRHSARYSSGLLTKWL